MLLYLASDQPEAAAHSLLSKTLLACHVVQDERSDALASVANSITCLVDLGYLREPLVLQDCCCLGKHNKLAGAGVHDFACHIASAQRQCWFVT